MQGLLDSVPDDAVHQVIDSTLGCLGWQLAHAVYRETFSLRERLHDDTRLTDPIRHLFDDGPADWGSRYGARPPARHLLAWASEIQDTHRQRLANPGATADHPWLGDDPSPGTWSKRQHGATSR
jgi:hypothetical protein